MVDEASLACTEPRVQSQASCKPGVLVCACDSSTQELEADPSLLYSGFGASLATKDLV